MLTLLDLLQPKDDFELFCAFLLSLILDLRWSREEEGNFCGVSS